MDSLSNGVQATTVPLLLPGGLAYDSRGNLYIASTNDHVIRKVDALGIINTVAGTGDQGFSGDGGAATSAELDSPVGIAVDALGNLYIADTHNNCIREVLAPTGIIHTIAGTRAVGFSGDGGAALDATFNLPTALVLDRTGNLYIADTNNHRIRKITGTTITTVAGDGEQIYAGDGGLAIAAGLDSPNGVALDGSNNIYIGDTHNQRLRLVTSSTGIITTVAGTGAKTYNGDGGAPTSSALARPRGLAVAPNGTLLIADTDNDRIRSINGGIILTVAGNGLQGFSGDMGPATTATLDTPRAVAATAQDGLVVADTNNDRVRAVNSAGNLNTIAGLGTTGGETLTLSGAAATVTYGSGSLVATFSSNGSTAGGSVTFYDVTSGLPVSIGAAIPLASNTATLNTGRLNAGSHSIVATYAGDPNNAAVSSGVSVLTIAPLAITAAAQAASIQYGQAIPTLGGTLNGVLAQDTGNVIALYSTTAELLSPSGAFPISVVLTGPAANNYSVLLAAPETLTIAPAGSQTLLTTSNPTPSLSAPVNLTAKVSSLTTGAPTGTVNFYNGAGLLNTTPAAVNGSGMAAISTSALPLGALSLTATYSGDTNFTPSTSTTILETVTTCDFSLSLTTTTGSQTQTVAPGGTASYAFTVTPAQPAFPDALTFTVSGLPAGATYTLTPTSLAAGAGVTSLTLVVTTANALAQLDRSSNGWRGLALSLLLLPFSGMRRIESTGKSRIQRFRVGGLLLILAAAVGLLSGCCTPGSFAAPPQSYPIVVTATSACMSHTQNVTLIVQ